MGMVMANNVAASVRLMLVTDDRLLAGRDLLAMARAAEAGGATAIQLRLKQASARELVALTRTLVAALRIPVLVNDRPDVALAGGAAGVHLGEASMPVPSARSLLGAHRNIGVSIHSLDGARRAEQEGADFVVFGPVYFTPSKSDLGVPQGIKALQNIVDNISLAVYAIGGIKADNVQQVKSVGSRGVALISAIMSAEEPALAAKRIIGLLTR